MSQPIVGFIGATGLMGHGMAKNIVIKGYPLRYTLRRDSDRVRDLDAAGARRLPDAAGLGRECDIVIVCVTAAADVEQVVTGPAGLLTDPKDGLVIADSTTSEPSVTRRLAATAANQSVAFVDAPLTRGPAQAEAGTLNVMLGGAEEAKDRVRTVLETFSVYLLDTGPIGTAHTLKLINNTVIQAFMASVAEGFGVAAKSGLDPQLVEEILSRGQLDNGFLHQIAAALGGDFAQMQFQLDNARKDVRYYTRLAGELGYVAPMGSAAHEALALASAQGLGSQFVPSLVKAQEKLNGVRLS